jgi:hypothetical protein
MKMSEPRIEFVLGELASDDPRDRANVLRGLAAEPLADQRVLAACEQLLDDRTITLLSIPYQFGEIRWVAAGAVAAVRGALGIREPVVVTGVFPPCSTDTVEKLVREAGLPDNYSGIEGVLGALHKLAELDRLPRRTIRREPY